MSKPNSKTNSSSKWVPVEAPRQVKPQAKPLTLEWTAKNFFESWSAEDLRLAIKKDIDIDLSLFLNYVADEVGEALQKWFTEKLGRPDLAEVFKTEEARRWVMRKIRMMQK
jgi:hypothetical protein